MRNMAAMSTMNGRRVSVFTGRGFLRATATESGLLMGVWVGAARKGGIGGV
jgi:hypothetical protein